VQITTSLIEHANSHVPSALASLTKGGLNLINQGHAMVAGLPVDIAKLLATSGRRRRRLRLKSAYGPKASRTSW
jgi:hypothetical protein